MLLCCVKSTKCTPRLLTAMLVAICPAGLQAEDATFLYTVQISATVQLEPPSINLNWEPDLYTVDSLTLYRKTKHATSWGTGITLSPYALSYTDTDIDVGSSYEYQIVKQAHSSAISWTGFGYIYAGVNAPLIESRGKLVLIVATESTIGLDNELARLQLDLTGDGWQVIRHDVSINDTPAYVRSLIVSDYNSDSANVN